MSRPCPFPFCPCSKRNRATRANRDPRSQGLAGCCEERQRDARLRGRCGRGLVPSSACMVSGASAKPRPIVNDLPGLKLSKRFRRCRWSKSARDHSPEKSYWFAGYQLIPPVLFSVWLNVYWIRPDRRCVRAPRTVMSSEFPAWRPADSICRTNPSAGLGAVR